MRRVFAQEQAREIARSFIDDPNARWTRMEESPESGARNSGQVREVSKNKMILKSGVLLNELLFELTLSACLEQFLGSGNYIKYLISLI